MFRALQEAQTQGSGWVCGRSLAHAKCGGWRYTARLHEIRAEGWQVEKRLCGCDRCRYSADAARKVGKRPARIYAWRLVAAPAEVAA